MRQDLRGYMNWHWKMTWEWFHNCLWTWISQIEMILAAEPHRTILNASRAMMFEFFKAIIALLFNLWHWSMNRWMMIRGLVMVMILTRVLMRGLVVVIMRVLMMGLFECSLMAIFRTKKLTITNNTI
jgi:hypothetical protein